MGTKICKKCGDTLTIDKFGKDKQRKDGLCLYCKECWKKRTKEWKANNRVKMLEQKKISYNKNRESILEKAKNNPKLKENRKKYYSDNKEKIEVYRKEYAINNKEKLSIKDKIYYQKNIERIAIYNANYRKNNADKLATKERLRTSSGWRKKYNKEHLTEHRIHSQKRSANKRKLLATLTKEQWNNIKLYFDNKCCYCGKKSPLEQEHFKPLSKLGEYTINNIVCACRSCNASKHDALFSEWYPNYKFYSKKREKNILKFLGYSNDEQQLKIV